MSGPTTMLLWLLASGVLIAGWVWAERRYNERKAWQRVLRNDVEWATLNRSVQRARQDFDDAPPNGPFTNGRVS